MHISNSPNSSGLKKCLFLISKILLIGGILLSSAYYYMFVQPKNPGGIEIPYLLYDIHSHAEYQRLETLIHRTLNKDSQALYELSQFDCKGGAGCYDLGYIITQIMFKMGEKDFITMCDKLNNEQLQQVRAFMDVGLKYGHGIDPKNFATTFPLFSRYYKQRTTNNELVNKQ